MLTHQQAHIALTAVHGLAAMILGAAGDFAHATIALGAAAVYAGLVRPRDER